MANIRDLMVASENDTSIPLGKIIDASLTMVPGTGAVISAMK